MVENSVRKFEDGVIKFSKSDAILTSQLLNYIIKSRSEGGKPLYDQENKAIGDHALDAFNLALVAWTIEEGIFAPAGFEPITRVGILGTALHNFKERMRKESEEKEFNEMDTLSLAEKVGFKNLAAPSRDPDKENHSITRPEVLTSNSRSNLYAEINERKRSLEKRSIDHNETKSNKVKTVRHGWFDDTEHLHNNVNVKQVRRQVEKKNSEIKRRSIP
jgi:hypothetical protein